MEGTLEGDVVRLSANARERFYDSRGYGRPRGDGLDLAPVEAAHLLARADLESVDGLDIGAVLARTGTALPYVVYRDLRARGFYLSPARWATDPRGADFVVYPRGQGPWDDEVEARVDVLGERDRVAAAEMGDCVLAVVDEDGDLTYFETGDYDPTGTADGEPPAAEGSLLADRVLVSDPPPALHDRHFYGQRLHGRSAQEGPVQLSLVEAAYLRSRGSLAVTDEPPTAVRDRGRAVEGERFDRRLRAYTALRDSGVVPKSGFKFGADFRCYEAFEDVASVGHSDLLVRVVPPEHDFAPRAVSLDVRLAAGVRKRTLFALTDGSGDVRWLTVERLTP